MKKRLNDRKRPPRIIAISLIICLTFFAFNQEAIAGVTGKIIGTITDSETGERLPMANCMLVGTNLGGACDEEGDYFILNIPPGTYSLQVRMIGYESVIKTGVVVSADHTTEVNFALRPTAVEVEGITIVAKREIVKMDMSASEHIATSEEIEIVPLVSDIEEYINLQAGIEDWEIRGGGLDQTAFMMDGLMMVDNRANELLTQPNLSSIKEINVVKGGFNAEYGNIRSGLVNVITKEGSFEKYHGSIDMRVSPAHYKHFGPSLFDHDNFYLRPYLELEDSVCWLGTDRWPDSLQEQFWQFEGWIAVSEALMSDGDSINDRTPEECRDRFIWLHTAEGCGELGQKVREYGNKPDWSVDLGFGGPIPIIKNLSFFLSYRTDNEMFGLPTIRDYYKDENLQLKITYRISNDMKLHITGLYGETQSITRATNVPNDINDYVRSGEDIFNIGFGTAGGTGLYFPPVKGPFDVYRNMEGISFDHALSPSTFYSLRFTHTRHKNWCNGDVRMRDTTTLRYFGNTPIDEAPYGAIAPSDALIEYGMMYGGWYAGPRDWSETNTFNFMGDLTSQINKYNQIKLGIVFNYDDFRTDFGSQVEFMPVHNRKRKSNNYPIRAGTYIQDKIEFEGIIANIGVRLDYSNPNVDWYTVDRYSKYFSLSFMDQLDEEAPREQAESHLKVSPRFGISHPISEDAKLYFNYGWFYSLPPATDMYDINYSQQHGIYHIGNPSADIPRTVAYELGYEHNIADLFLLHIAGYYKDVSDQTGSVWYTNYDGTVHYSTDENNNYEDIRGFEFSIRKRVGPWITGWINYDYMVRTSGYIGREEYFQDERENQLYGLQNPYQERPLARPSIRSVISLTSPDDWGPTIAGIKPFGDLNISLLYTWKAGRYQTWDPLETYELKDNVQWKAYSNWDARLSKSVTIGENRISLFMDINNLLNTKILNSGGFEDDQDYRDYMRSLHLPLYKGEEYQAEGLEPGNDRPGDIKSKSKSYIDMPNLNFRRFLNPRSITFGLTVDF